MITLSPTCSLNLRCTTGFFLATLLLLADLNQLLFVHGNIYNKTTVEGKPVHAHKVLCMRCTYFRAMLTGEMKESRAKTITLPDVRRPIFLALLEYLYTDEVRTCMHPAAGTELYV